MVVPLRGDDSPSGLCRCEAHYMFIRAWTFWELVLRLRGQCKLPAGWADTGPFRPRQQARCQPACPRHQPRQCHWTRQPCSACKLTVQVIVLMVTLAVAAASGTVAVTASDPVRHLSSSTATVGTARPGSRPPVLPGEEGLQAGFARDKGAATGSGSGKDEWPDSHEPPSRWAAGSFASSQPAMVFVSPNGIDGPGCGGSANRSCATLRHAVNEVANTMQPLDAVVSVFVAPGGYSASFCGAKSTRALAVVGSGSSASIVNCQQASQLITSNSSISLSGMTVMGGRVNVSITMEPKPEVPPLEAREGPRPRPKASTVASGLGLAVGGGGAVSVLWPVAANDMYAVVHDVVFVNNSVNGSVSGVGSRLFYVGGGALFVGGGGNGTSVVVSSSAFDDNFVTASATVSDSDSGAAVASGGGICIVLGVDSSSEAAASQGQRVTVSSVTAHGNTVSASARCVSSRCGLINGGTFSCPRRF